jgi:hypothetical protein
LAAEFVGIDDFRAARLEHAGERCFTGTDPPGQPD